MANVQRGGRPENAQHTASTQVTLQPPTPTIERHPAMLRCAKCGDRMKSDPNCSYRAILTLHWMSKHRKWWLKTHPEVRGII